MHFGDHFRAPVSADHNPRYRFTQLRPQPAHQFGADLAVIQVIVNQHQLRTYAFIEQCRTFFAVARSPDAASPAGQQALHTDQNAVFIIDTQHLGARHGLAVLFGNHWLRCSLALGHGHADAEHTAKPLPGTHLQGVPEYVAEAVSNRQAQAQTFFGPGLMAVEAFELFKYDLQFVFRDTRPAIPYFKAQLAAAPTYAQQYRAFGVTKGVGQEVLQDAAQQFDIAVDPHPAAANPEVQALFLGLGGELIAQGFEQIINGERFDVRGDFAVFQARNIQQVADQVFGRAQGTVQMLHQFLRFGVQAFFLMGESGREQACSVHGLHQVMADGGQEAGFRLAGRFGHAFGLG